jgi:hypothetical protein
LKIEVEENGFFPQNQLPMANYQLSISRFSGLRELLTVPNFQAV